MDWNEPIIALLKKYRLADNSANIQPVAESIFAYLQTQNPTLSELSKFINRTLGQHLPSYVENTGNCRNVAVKLLEQYQKVQRDEHFMRLALEQAQKAYALGEVPIGAVIVKGEEVIATGFNRREIGKNALYHAELTVIDEACQKLGGWRLWECELYVTLEPCPMCAGAIINSRIHRVVYGSDDDKAGSCRSVVRLFDLPYNHKPKMESGILARECAEILSDFFQQLRNRKK